MRAARLLSIQMLLETRGQLSARQLADACEVSIRTLHRDVDHLAAAGVPIVAERGRSGGFRLLEGWNTRLTGLTPSEAQAVFLSGLAGPAADLGLRGPMQSAQLKLLTALPVSWREDATRVQSRFHLDPVDWYREPDPVPYLAAVAEAVWGDRQLSIRYQSWRGVGDRVVSPLGLVLKAGSWYFIGTAANGLRTYRIAGLRAAAALPARVKRPKGFDLAREWAHSVARFEKSVYTGVARVRCTSDGLAALRLLNAATARAVTAATRASSTDETFSVSVPIESIEHATGQLLALAPAVTVIEPQALRSSIVRRLRSISRAYRAS
jgi:predicted DNA-binding transcriptional regulator YafY